MQNKHSVLFLAMLMNIVFVHSCDVLVQVKIAVQSIIPYNIRCSWRIYGIFYYRANER